MQEQNRWRGIFSYPHSHSIPTRTAILSYHTNKRSLFGRARPRPIISPLNNIIYCLARLVEVRCLTINTSAACRRELCQAQHLQRIDGPTKSMMGILDILCCSSFFAGCTFANHPVPSSLVRLLLSEEFLWLTVLLVTTMTTTVPSGSRCPAAAEGSVCAREGRRGAAWS